MAAVEVFEACMKLYDWGDLVEIHACVNAKCFLNLQDLIVRLICIKLCKEFLKLYDLIVRIICIELCKEFLKLCDMTAKPTCTVSI